MRRNRLAALRTGASQILRQWSGPLTRDLMLTAGPVRPRPRAGAPRARPDHHHGVRLLLDRLRAEDPPARRRGGEPVAGADYPVNIGMACPKGWESADRRCAPPIAPPSRCCASAATAACAAGRTGTWPVALERWSSRFKAIQAKHGPASVAFLWHRPDRHRGDGAAGRAGEVRHGHGARRRQHPPVHGDGRRRLQAELRLRRAAVTPTATSRSRT